MTAMAHRLAAAVQLMASVPVVAVTGPSGVGKTSLAEALTCLAPAGSSVVIHQVPRRRLLLFFHLDQQSVPARLEVT